jgi:hypothetical protein
MSEAAAPSAQGARGTLLRLAIVALAAGLQVTWIGFMIWLVVRVSNGVQFWL